MSDVEAIGIARLHEAGFGSVADTLLELAEDESVSIDVYEKVCAAVFAVLDAWAGRQPSGGTWVVRMARLSDGRWGAENGQGVADLTLDDLHGLIDAFKLWAGIQWERKGGKP